MQQQQPDKCPICLDSLPMFDHLYTRYLCCGNGIHNKCFQDYVQSSSNVQSLQQPYNCVFCRTKMPYPGSKEERKGLQKWVKKEKRWAQFLLGRDYETGQGGMRKSYKLAAKYYQLAHDQGDIASSYNLGCFYQFGRIGRRKSLQNYAKAKEFYEVAIAKGLHAEAHVNLGMMYFKGLGVVQSTTKAETLWKKVATLEITLQDGVIYTAHNHPDAAKTQALKNLRRFIPWYSNTHASLSSSSVEYNGGLPKKMYPYATKNIKKRPRLAARTRTTATQSTHLSTSEDDSNDSEELDSEEDSDSEYPNIERLSRFGGSFHQKCGGIFAFLFIIPMVLSLIY